jgi:uncharacterized protein DUF6084
MPDLNFAIDSVRVEPHAASPTLVFRLRITEASGARVHAGLLRCQLQIDPRGRRYSPPEGERLVELFDRPERWIDTVRPIFWTQVSVVVPQFEQTVDVEVPVACTYDVEVASAKYFHALEDGEIPIVVMFSGTIFVAAGDRVHAMPVSWDQEARFRMPVQTWRDVMREYFADSAWIRLRRDSFDALCRFRARHALPSWEATVDALCAGAEREPV